MPVMGVRVTYEPRVMLEAGTRTTVSKFHLKLSPGFHRAFFPWCSLQVGSVDLVVPYLLVISFTVPFAIRTQARS